MVDPNSCPSLLSGWSVKTSPFSYFTICALIAIMVRVVHCIIKAWSTGGGEHGEDLAKWPFVKRFAGALCGFGKNKLADHWLGTIIGFAEISFYPVLIFTNNLSAIGAWFAIKTAGGWNLWKEHPRAFNRFLITNLINLAIAYFFTIKLIQ